jgi:hypothetical protein
MEPGVYRSIIPVETISYSETDLERWRALWRAWIASNRTDWSVWEEFEPIARSEGFKFAHRRGPVGFFFGEAIVALKRHREGYRCWTGGLCSLFRHKLPQLAAKVQVTEAVETLLANQRLPRPFDLQPRLDFKARNPDLLCYRVDSREARWRFSEVKLNSDRVSRDQLQSLAVLRDILGAQVEVVRLVPGGTKVGTTTHLRCSYRLR